MEDKNLVDEMRDALAQKAEVGSKSKYAWNEKVVPGEYPRHIILPDGSSEIVYGKLAIRPNGQVVPLRGHSAAQIDKILSEEGIVYLSENMEMPEPVPTEQEIIKATAIVRLGQVPKVAWDGVDKDGKAIGGIEFTEGYVVVPFISPSVGPTLGSTTGSISRAPLGPTTAPYYGPTTGPSLPPTTAPYYGLTTGPSLPPTTAPYLAPTPVPSIGPTTGPMPFSTPAPIPPGYTDGKGGKR